MLDLTKLFRDLGRERQESYAAAIERRRDDRSPQARRRGPPGGSLPTHVRSPHLLRVTAWGYVLRLAELGQPLTWWIRGTSHQPPRKPRRRGLTRAQVVTRVYTEVVRQLRREFARAGVR